MQGRNSLRAVCEAQIFSKGPASDSTKWSQMYLSYTDVQLQLLQHRSLQTEHHYHTSCDSVNLANAAIFFFLELNQRVDLFQRLLYL